MEGRESPISNEWEKVRLNRGQEVFVRNEEEKLEGGWEYMGYSEETAHVQRNVRDKFGNMTKSVESKEVSLEQLKKDFLEGYRRQTEIEEMANEFNEMMKQNDPRPLPGSSDLLRWTDEGKIERVAVLASVEEEPKKSQHAPESADIDEKTISSDEVPTQEMPALRMEQLSYEVRLRFAHDIEEFSRLCNEAEGRGIMIETGTPGKPNKLSGAALKERLRVAAELKSRHKDLRAADELRAVSEGPLRDTMERLAGIPGMIAYAEEHLPELFPKK